MSLSLSLKSITEFGINTPVNYVIVFSFIINKKSEAEKYKIQGLHINS